eukprot:TRINITY_DN72811_c0_g1_i1.p1 TRINITY_DN72811_c0_g1~~TRINITY_DN72811_c0_g1_i1.p1  ORF type:complete len:191 (+),score=58.53 TRINITY_DN72811_c0_g1_i1:146-718(+)
MALAPSAGRILAPPASHLALAEERHVAIFDDVHGSLETVAADLAHHRQVAQQNDAEIAMEIDRLRKKLERERYEHREQINGFRYDFESMVHGKIEKLIELIDKIHQIERRDDAEQKERLAQLHIEMRLIKENVAMVGDKWQRLAQRIEGRRSIREVTAQFERREEAATPVVMARPEDREGTPDLEEMPKL